MLTGKCCKWVHPKYRKTPNQVRWDGICGKLEVLNSLAFCIKGFFLKKGSGGRWYSLQFPFWWVGKCVRNYSVCMRILCQIIFVEQLFWKICELQTKASLLRIVLKKLSTLHAPEDLEPVFKIFYTFVCEKVLGKITDKYIENLKQASGEI